MKIFKLDQYREINDPNNVYSDVLSHSKNPVLFQSRSTNVHETCHMISNQIRNERGSNGKFNGFYYENGRGLTIKEPNLTIVDIRDYVPKNLRGMRYNLYFNDQVKYWNDQPLYIMEEWNCYILGGSCAVKDAELDMKLERTDAVAGCFEFMIYSTALFMCIKDKDPNYDMEQFKEFFFDLFDRSEIVFNKGRKIPSYKSPTSDKFYEEYTNSSEGKTFKLFLEREYDQDMDYGFNYL